MVSQDRQDVAVEVLAVVRSGRRGQTRLSPPPLFDQIAEGQAAGDASFDLEPQLALEGDGVAFGGGRAGQLVPAAGERVTWSLDDDTPTMATLLDHVGPPGRVLTVLLTAGPV